VEIIPILIIAYFVIAWIKVTKGGKSWFVAATWPCQAIWELGDDLQPVAQQIDPTIAAQIADIEAKLKAWQSSTDATVTPVVNSALAVAQAKIASYEATLKANNIAIPTVQAPAPAVAA
jgi:hypothetical protein